jgi:hypothetical protein
MKWGLALVALLLGVVVTMFLTARRADRRGVDEEDVAEADDGSAFGGARTEFSVLTGPAESWDRDAQDEDALLSREDEAPAGPAVGTDATPVAEATPRGDVAGVGEPDAIEAVEAVRVTDDPAGPGDEDTRRP